MDVPQAIARTRPYRSAACTVAASGSPQVARLARRNTGPYLPRRSAHPHSGRDSATLLGCTLPTARVVAERSILNQHADTSGTIPQQRCTSVARRRPADTSRCFAPAAHGLFPWSGREPGLAPFMPQRTCLGKEFSDHLGGQACAPPAADDRCTRRVPDHTPAINDQGLDVTPPTMLELVAQAQQEHGTASGRGLAWCPARCGLQVTDRWSATPGTGRGLQGPAPGPCHYSSRRRRGRPGRAGSG